MRKLEQKRVQKGKEAKEHYKYFKLENGGFAKIENGEIKTASFSEINDLNEGKLPFSTDIPEEMKEWEKRQGCGCALIVFFVIFILVIISLLFSN